MHAPKQRPRQCNRYRRSIEVSQISTTSMPPYSQWLGTTYRNTPRVLLVLESKILTNSISGGCSEGRLLEYRSVSLRSTSYEPSRAHAPCPQTGARKPTPPVALCANRSCGERHSSLWVGLDSPQCTYTERFPTLVGENLPGRRRNDPSYGMRFIVFAIAGCVIADFLDHLYLGAVQGLWILIGGSHFFY